MEILQQQKRLRSARKTREQTLSSTQLEELVLEYLMRQKNMISMQLDVTQIRIQSIQNTLLQVF